MTGPLEGVRIITFTQAWAGTSATEQLGLLGADVIQIESLTHPDTWRGGFNGPMKAAADTGDGPRKRPWNVASAYNSVNLNKRAITIDVAHPDGLALFERLVPLADVIADNFTPDVMRKWGLTYERLNELRPGIIVASLSAYGASGPLRNVRGIGGTMEPMSGLTSLLGYEGGRPMNSGAMIPDAIAGAWFAAAIVTAIRHRGRTGEGQCIDLGMMEANAMLTGDALLEFTANGRVRPRMGNRHPRLAPHNIYPAADDSWLALCVEDDEQWQALCEVIGDPAMAGDARFPTMELRKANEPALDAFIERWTSGQDAASAESALLASGVPAARVRPRTELLDHPALQERGFGVEVDYPEAGRQRVAGTPWKMTRTDPEVSRPSPMLGEHSQEVFAELLGMGAKEYEDLVRSGISGDEIPGG